jgi:hypothetical protein
VPEEKYTTTAGELAASDERFDDQERAMVLTKYGGNRSIFECAGRLSLWRRYAQGPGGST